MADCERRTNAICERQFTGENLRGSGAIGYRLGWNMSAKPTLVVHSRRTDEADGDGSNGAGADGLRRESTASSGEGSGSAARKSSGDRADGESARGRRTGGWIQNAKREA